MSGRYVSFEVQGHINSGAALARMVGDHRRETMGGGQRRGEEMKGKRRSGCKERQRQGGNRDLLE